MAAFEAVSLAITDSFLIGWPAPFAEAGEKIAKAMKLAADSDVAVVVGTTNEVETQGRDRMDLELPGYQNELVRRVATVNPRTIVVVNAGAPALLP